MNRNQQSYDAFTKVLHWGMAVGLFFMMFSVALHFFAKDTPIFDLVWPFHYKIGFMILFFGAIRLLWLIKNLITSSNPSSNIVAKMAHYGMYVLMIVIPSLALLRDYGAGRGFEILGITIFKGDENREIESLVELGNNFHAILGFLLFAMIFGHIFATIWHYRKGENVLRKII
jgi:cytochrome b561